MSSEKVNQSLEDIIKQRDNKRKLRVVKNPGGNFRRNNPGGEYMRKRRFNNRGERGNYSFAEKRRERTGRGRGDRGRFNRGRGGRGRGERGRGRGYRRSSFDQSRFRPRRGSFQNKGYRGDSIRQVRAFFISY